jgi:hypothetical protein
VNAGTYTVKADFNQTTNYSSASATKTISIDRRNTSSVGVDAPSPSSTFGQNVTITATVSGSDVGSGDPGAGDGSVTFIEGGSCTSPTTTLAGPTALNTQGKASFNKSNWSVGSHTIIACYGGATNFKPSNGNVSHEVVNTAPAVALDAGNDLSVNEGTAHTYVFSITDPDSGDSWSFASGYPSCGDNGTLVSGSASISSSEPKGSFRCTFADGPKTSDVKVKVKDAAEALSTEDKQSVAVANVAPTVTGFSGPNVLYGPLVFGLNGSFTGTFTDPGLVDNPWIASFTWAGVADTDPTHQLSILANGTDTHTFTARPTFTSFGCNKVAIAKVTDKNGDFGTKTATVQVGTGEFLAPVSNTPVTDKLKNGQVLPVKVRIADCNGNPITGLAPTIVLKKGDLTDGVNDDSTVTVTPESVSGADSNGVMRPADGYYIYNMRVSLPNADLGITPYTIIITPGITGYVGSMQLRHKIMATK